MSLLSIDDLHVTFHVKTGPVHAVRGVSFVLGQERLGIVGESGSGKTTTGLAILRLIAPSGRMVARRMLFKGIDLLGLPEKEMRIIRGRYIAMIMQDPVLALNPVMRIGTQLTEGLCVFGGLGKAQARLRALEMLEAVHIRDPERVFSAYAHELSGGIGQRVMIAMMLLPEPDILIADEPTSALDACVQGEVLGILDRMVRERGMGLIIISHDLQLLRKFCDRILVMYKGRLIDETLASELDKARHPYTRGLLDCLPKIDGPRGPLPVLERNSKWAE